MFVIKATYSNRYVVVANSGKFNYVRSADEATSFANSQAAIAAIQKRERTLGISSGRGTPQRGWEQNTFALVQMTDAPVRRVNREVGAVV